MVSISDIHFGRIDPAKEYDILKREFIDKIKDLDFDLLAICGDLFHKKEMANSFTIQFANMFILDLLKVCRKKEATLLILSGTFEHDHNQIETLFLPLSTNEDNFVIFSEIGFFIHKGIKFLVIPEKYGMGEDYYKEYLENDYDLCLMHGTYVGSIFGKNKPDLNAKREPVFQLSDFRNCKNVVLSGHIHIRKIYDDKFFYHGSVIRSSFGEEEAKGFYYTELYENDYDVEFIEVKSDKYDTIVINEDRIEDPIKLVNDIDEKLKTTEFIRIKINSSTDGVDIIKKYFISNKRVTVNVFNNIKKEVVDEDNVNEFNSIVEEFSFIFDKELTAEDKLSKYIEKKEEDSGNHIESGKIKEIVSK